MDNSLIQSINKFQKMGEDIKNSLSNRGAWGGWYKVLTELYPDNAHFLFELLQNAEDVYATKVKFELESDSLVFKHNGTKEFSESDIDSITNIGESSKKVNKIGKFGVGFKSVFSYTESPKIHTKAISFEIKDLVIPFLIDSQPIEKDFTTVFIFKFDKSDKPKKQAFKEIDQFFDEVDDSVLLFLNNIRSVEWTIKNNKPITITKEINGEFTEIKKTKIVKQKVEVYLSSWLVFRKAIKVVKKTITVGVAFLYDREKKELQATEGNVSIYFPAKKETSKLKFHIDAPFSSSVARDSIVDSSDENNEILANIGQLCAEKIDRIKELGLLKKSFFEILPIDEDNLSSFYKPIFDTLKEEFESNRELIPLGKGKFSSINNCVYVSNNTFKKIFKDKEDINIVFNNDSLLGYATLPKKTSRSYRFLSAIDGFKEYEDDDIYERLYNLSSTFYTFKIYREYSYMFSDDEREGIPKKIKWLEIKSDEWLQSLYAFLSDDNNGYSDVSFIKLADGSFNFSHESLYFPQEKLSIDAELTFVDSSTYSSGNNKKQQEKALAFLQSEGVRSIDESTHIRFLFSSYQFVSKKQYLIDINRLVAFYIDNRGDAVSTMESYHHKKFIYSEGYLNHLVEEGGEKANENTLLATPDEVFIDSPYESTGLRLIYSQFYSYPFMISDMYKKLENWSAFIELLKDLGVHTKLEIKRTGITNNPEQGRMLKEAEYGRRSDYYKNIDWNIDDLEEILSLKNNKFEISKLLWDTVTNAGKKQLIAEFRMNAQCEIVTAKSQLIYNLMEHEWIPDKEGVFYKPAVISKDMLHPDFIYDNTNEWLDSIGFGTAAAEKLKQDDEKKDAYGIIGISPEEADILKGMSPEVLKELINLNAKTKRKKLEDEGIKKEKEKLPDAMKRKDGDGQTPPVAKERGQTEIIKDEKKLDDAIEKENKNWSEKKDANIRRGKKQKPEATRIIRDFLYEQYDGHCQICGDTFKNKERNFFIKFPLNKSIKGNKLEGDVNRKGNSLSLCPKHDKMLDLGLQTFSFLEKLDSSDLSLSLIKEKFKYFEYVGNEDVLGEDSGFYNRPEESSFVQDVFMAPIELSKKKLYIKFTLEHILNFKSVWNNT